jgi:hypothetical protein
MQVLKFGVLTSYRKLMGTRLGFSGLFENKPDERVSLVSFGCVKSHAPNEGVELHRLAGFKCICFFGIIVTPLERRPVTIRICSAYRIKSEGNEAEMKTKAIKCWISDL